MAKLEFVWRDENAREQFLSLKSAVFSPEAVERKAKTWDWMFSCPAGNQDHRTRLLFLEKDGAPVGAQILMPTMLVVDGQTYEASLPSSTLVHPGHRGVGLRLVRAPLQLEDMPPSSFGLARDDRLNNYYVKSGGALSPPRILCRKIYNLGQVIRERKPVPGVLSQALTTIGKLGVAATNMRRPKPRSNEAISQIETFSVEFDTAWDEVAPRIGFAQARSSRFLNWRYVDMPIRQYKRAELRRDGRLIGYVVISLYQVKDSLVGRVVDIFAYQDDARDYALLLGWADRQFIAQRCDRSEISFGVTPSIEKAARLCGFLLRKEIRSIAAFVRDPAGRERLPHGLETIHFCRGDHDEDY